MRERYYKKTTLMKLLNCSANKIEQLVKDGAPKAIPFKGYPALEFLKWIVESPRKRSDRTKTRERAQNILSELTSKKEKPGRSSGKRSGRGKPDEKNQAEYAGMVGALAALERLRYAELDAFNRYQKELEKGVVNQTYLSNWHETSKMLRQGEKDFQAILIKQGRLMEFEKLIDWALPAIEEAKTKLLNLGRAIAPRCDGVEWQEVQEQVDYGVKTILEQFISTINKQIKKHQGV